MALIKCGECNKDVSDKASSCPHCGNPIATAAERAATGDSTVITTQDTAKKFKSHQIFGVALVAIGIFLSFMVHESMFGSFVVVLGVGWYVTARCRAWWHHG